MKALLSLLAAVSVLSFAAPASAAHYPFPTQRRIVNYVNGMPVYAVYQVVGYNRMGHPIYQWVTQPMRPVYSKPMPPGHWNHFDHHDHGLHKGWFKH
ncbi:hypothetical protein [Prosthecobacter sp.]|uniref:hypothetical protein n=1 Tax=Prosthecobacter sp. TaxID=1965333 RepID=UPI003784F5C5